MKKVIRNTLIVLGIAALSACTMDEMDSGFDKVPVEFSVVDSAAAQMTRATSSITTFNSGETVKVYVKPNGASNYTGYDYTTAAAGNAPSLTAPSTPPYFPAGSSTTVQAYAYYPSTAGTTFSVSTNQTTDANYKASDLMYASNRTITKGSTTGTALAMSHKMAQLKLVVAAASGSGLSISNVKVNAKYQVSFTASSGAATLTGSATDITALTAAGTGYILIPPQAINGITVKVTASSQTATYTFTSTNSLEAGKSYTMNLTVGLNDVGVTTSISTWTGSGTVTVNPTVETEVFPLSLANSTHVGKVICSNGHIHNTVSAVSCGGSAVAMIVYVGAAGTADNSSSTYKGLAIALTDAPNGAMSWKGSGGGTCVYQSTTFSNHYGYADMKGIANTNQMVNKTGNCSSHSSHNAARAAKNYSNTVAGCSQWFLPSSGQWMRFFRNSKLNLTWSDWGYCSQGKSGLTNVNKMFTDAGASDAVFKSGDEYWSSSEYDSNQAVTVSFATATLDGPAGVRVNRWTKEYNCKVRAFLAF